MIIKRAETTAEIEQCLSIREVVFVEEQGVPISLERDSKDDKALHYIAFDDDEALGAARVLIMDDVFRFQRVAVLGHVRGRGIGTEMMRFMMDELADRPDAAGKRFFLSSQANVIPFYDRLGFKICSDPYMEAGIEHRDMVADIEISEAA
ncbi:MAG: GNAT family N-acetyltransferase [Pseudomonadota bacterium]